MTLDLDSFRDSLNHEDPVHALICGNDHWTRTKDWATEILFLI
jgi:hypothetical protein